MKILIFVLCLFCTAFISCSVTESENQPLYSPDHKTPVTGGIVITSKYDPTPLGAWGNPSNPNEWKLSGFASGPSYKGGAYGFWLENPFPDPAKDSTRIFFQVPKVSNVRVYIVPARLMGSPDNSTSLIVGGVFLSPQGIAIKVLENKLLQPGHHWRDWDLTDNNNSPVPAGFYRVYMEAGSDLLWRDILVYRDKKDLPADLRTLLMKIYNITEFNL
ncbi:MAG TPA: hypothetical protein VHO03_08360 [Ignavibacteriales bacterium]|nr:hypothetical protein [Ignavibacteriales bacterium]